MSDDKPINIETRIKQYVQLRDYLDQAKKEFEKTTERVKKALAKLDAEFLEHFNASGAKNVTCDTGTVYKIPRYSVSVKDRDAFLRFLVVERKLEALDVRANKKIVKELLEEGIEVPGISYSESIQIGIRRGKTDE